jgi:outer membrane lipoprotein-sorting protein
MYSSLVLAVIALWPTQDPTWRDIVQPGFKDLSFVGTVLQADSRELKKISSDFAASYRLLNDDVSAKLKEPFMIRMEAHVEDTNVLFVENGTRRLFKVPNISKVENVSSAPGKRQSLLDFGILTPSLFESLFDAKFVRQDRESGDWVFDLTYKEPSFDDTSRQRIWVENQKHYTTKRMWFAQDGHQMATFLYQSPVLQNGVWIPSKVVVKNVDDRVAGITEYKSVRVNTGLSDQPFHF